MEDRQLTAVEHGEVEAARRATMAALRPTAHRILLFWQAKRNPRHLVRNDDTFLSPLILARRHKGAIKLQCAFRRYRAIRWKTQAIAARRVQRVWRSGVLRARLLETARLALGAAGRRGAGLGGRQHGRGFGSSCEEFAPLPHRHPRIGHLTKPQAHRP